jgi:hypothetical protein
MPTEAVLLSRPKNAKLLERGEIKIMQMIEAWRPAKGAFAITCAQQKTVIDEVVEVHFKFARAQIGLLRRKPNPPDFFVYGAHQILEEVPGSAVEMWERVIACRQFVYDPAVHGAEPFLAGSLPFAADSSDLAKAYLETTKFAVKERTHERIDPLVRRAVIHNLKKWSRFDVWDILQELRRSSEEQRNFEHDLQEMERELRRRSLEHDRPDGAAEAVVKFATGPVLAQPLMIPAPNEQDRRADPFTSEQDRRAALSRAQGNGTKIALAASLGIDRTRLFRWEQDRLKDDKKADTRERIERKLSKILATLK